ncbi:MAG: hypothetical protein ACKOXL_07830 [Limnohabitans sp.]
MQILKEKTGFFKSPFLAGGFNPDKNLGNGQDGRETIHGRGRIMHLSTQATQKFVLEAISNLLKP